MEPVTARKIKSRKRMTIKNARSNKVNNRKRISLTDECILALNTSTWLSIKFVADTMHGNDQLGWLQFSAQVADVRINGALQAFKGDAMRGGQQLSARKNT